MHAVHLPVLAGAWLLVGSGLTKTFRPAPTERAIRALLVALRLPPSLARATLVRTLGVVEVAVGVVVLTTDAAWATWALGLLYAAFSGFLLAALATGAPLRSCGCFGAADAPPSLVHLAIDVAIAAFAALAGGDAEAPSATLRASSGAGLAASLALAALCIAAFRRPVGARR